MVVLGLWEQNSNQEINYCENTNCIANSWSNK